MSLITSEEDPSGLSNTVASLEKQLRGMCEDLEALSDRVPNAPGQMDGASVAIS